MLTCGPLFASFFRKRVVVPSCAPPRSDSEFHLLYHRKLVTLVAALGAIVARVYNLAVCCGLCLGSYRCFQYCAGSRS